MSVPVYVWSRVKHASRGLIESEHLSIYKKMFFAYVFTEIADLDWL